MRMTNRWGIAVAAVVTQVALGGVYAWSIFRVPLAGQFGWGTPQVTLVFTICISALSVAAFLGGLWLNRGGPRVVAVTGGLLYGLGVSLASLADHGLWWLYLSFGRVFWTWASDSVTRRAAFLVMFLAQAALFWLLPSINSPAVTAGVAFLVLLCYGGGFGVMPAFAADYFGSRTVGPIYGLMLTAWGCASAFGPLLIAYLREASGATKAGSASSPG